MTMIAQLADVLLPAPELSWLSYRSKFSVCSSLSLQSVASTGSILSIASAGSILSISSAGSILSAGSAGSILSVASAGSILSVRSKGKILCIDDEPMVPLAATPRKLVGVAAAIAVLATVGSQALKVLSR